MRFFADDTNPNTRKKYHDSSPIWVNKKWNIFIHEDKGLKIEIKMPTLQGKYIALIDWVLKRKTSALFTTYIESINLIKTAKKWGIFK